MDKVNKIYEEDLSIVDQGRVQIEAYASEKDGRRSMALFTPSNRTDLTVDDAWKLMQLLLNAIRAAEVE